MCRVRFTYMAPISRLAVICASAGTVKSIVNRNSVRRSSVNIRKYRSANVVRSVSVNASSRISSTNTTKNWNASISRNAFHVSVMMVWWNAMTWIRNVRVSNVRQANNCPLTMVAVTTVRIRTSVRMVIIVIRMQVATICERNSNVPVISATKVTERIVRI